MTNDGNFLGNDIYIGTNGISLLFFCGKCEKSDV